MLNANAHRLYRSTVCWMVTKIRKHKVLGVCTSFELSNESFSSTQALLVKQKIS